MLVKNRTRSPKGWWVLQPTSHREAKTVRVVTMAERQAYLDLFPTLRLILCRRDQIGPDVCDYPMARGIVVLTVAVLAEEIADFTLADKPRRLNWSITLRDLAVKRMG